MLHRGLDFRTVRVQCRACGWFRNIAHAGCADGKRALVSVSSSDDPSHVLRARVIEVPEDVPLSVALKEHPEYRDLISEAHQKGLLALMREFQPLLEGRACPRCKRVGNLELTQLWNAGREIRY